MRYFVYQDTQIMGPFTREDLGQVHGLHGDSLVCPEGSMGSKETEWRSAMDVGELNGLFSPGAGLKAAPVMEMSAGGPPDFYDRLGEETRSILGGFGYSGEWTSGIFEDPDFFQHWGTLVDAATTRSEELELTKIKAQSLEQALDEMTKKISRYERQQNEILERLNLKDRALEAKEQTVQALETRLPQLERSLESARDELRKAHERLVDAQRGAAPAAFIASPAAPPVAPPPPLVIVTPPQPAPIPEARIAAPVPAAPAVELPQSPAMEPLAVLPEAPSNEPLPALATEWPAPAAPARARPAAPPAAKPAPAAPRPRFEPPAPIKLKGSSLRPSGVEFMPPAPKAAPAAAEPAVAATRVPTPVPASVDLAVRTPTPLPEVPVADAAAAAPIEAPPAQVEASEAPAEPAPAPAETAAAPTTLPGGVEPLPAGILVTGWGDAAGFGPSAESAPPAFPASEPGAAQPAVPALEMMSAIPGVEFAAMPPPLVAAPEPEAIVFSPEPAQPPETLVQRRSAEAKPVTPAPSQDLAATEVPSPWGFGPGGEPPAVPPIELAPIPTPEPAPALEPAIAAATGTPASGGSGLLELAAGVVAAAGAGQGVANVPVVPEDTSTPARIEPVGALDRPHTMRRSVPGPQPAQEPAPEQPVPANATPVPAAASRGKSFLSKLLGGKKEPEPTTQTAEAVGAVTMQRRRQSKAFLIGLGAAFACLLAAGAFFLKDPKDVIQLFTMSPKKKTLVDPDQIAAPPTSLSQVRPKAPEATPSPAPSTAPAAPKTPDAGTPGRDYVADSMVAAIDFAKKQPAGKGRANIGKWLSSSLVKQGDEEEWSAGAVEASIYLVSYRYFKGGRAAKQEPATYLFEVDLDKKTIKGRNPLAKELLAGAAKASAPRAPVKRVKKSRPAAPDAPENPAAEPATQAEETPPPLDDLLGPNSREPATPGSELSGE